MSEMIKVALHCAKFGAELEKCEDCSAYQRCDHSLVRDVSRVFVEALEKQIPKKPTFVDVRFRSHGRHISDGTSLDKCFKCPGCNSHIFHVFDSEIYCKYCGQALNWEELSDE